MRRYVSKADLSALETGLVASGYRQTRNYQPKGTSYRRCALYVAAQDPEAPLIDVLYGPTKPFMPGCRLRIRARMARLISSTDLGRVRAISAVGEPKVASVEVATDFPMNGVSFDSLARQLRCRYSRVHYREDKWEWLCCGSRRSDSHVRLYAKVEDGLCAVRLECTFRAAALRAHGVRTIYDLFGRDWSKLVTQKVRLVRIEIPHSTPHRTRKRLLACRSLVTFWGLPKALRRLDRSRREMLQRYLQDSVDHAGFKRALQEMAWDWIAIPMSPPPVAPRTPRLRLIPGNRPVDRIK